MLSFVDAVVLRAVAYPNADSRVAVASCGSWGDAGSGANGFFALGGRSGARLWRSEREYVEAVTSRHISRAATRKTIVSGGFCMGASLGLDNRRILPPFFPVLRGSDSIFGEVLSQRLPHSFFAALPRALAHRPPVTRLQTFDEIWEALSGVPMANLVEIAVRSSPETTDEDVSLSLRRLGRYLEDLGSLSLPSFREFFTIQCIRSDSWQTQQLQQRIDDLVHTPRWFARYLRRYIEIVGENQTRSNYIVPTDLANAVGAERALPLAQDLTRRYGLLLQAWPQIVDAALSIRDA